MQYPILHHYWGSPYAEKVRLYLGYKQMEWRSCEIAVTPPRPSLAAVLGDFRRTPVLQVGADYICDTRLILDAVDALSSDRPGGHSALSDFICGWVEPRAFVLLGAVRFQTVADVEGIFGGQVSAQQFRGDRLPFMRPAYEPARFSSLRDPARDHLKRYLGVIDKALSGGSPFIGGPEPSHGDFSAYHTIWWLRAPPSHPELLADYPRIERWADRIAGFGHGAFKPVSDSETFAAAKGANANKIMFMPDWPQESDHRLGCEVEVVADDYGRAPVTGKLAAMTDRHVTLERESEQAGQVRVHFPRLGYEIVSVENRARQPA